MSGRAMSKVRYELVSFAAGSKKYVLNKICEDGSETIICDVCLDGPTGRSDWHFCPTCDLYTHQLCHPICWEL